MFPYWWNKEIAGVKEKVAREAIIRENKKVEISMERKKGIYEVLRVLRKESRKAIGRSKR